MESTYWGRHVEQAFRNDSVVFHGSTLLSVHVSYRYWTLINDYSLLSRTILSGIYNILIMGRWLFYNISSCKIVVILANNSVMFIRSDCFMWYIFWSLYALFLYNNLLSFSISILVVPGRITRMLAITHMNLLRLKQIFVRYVSHEIRFKN